MTGPEQAPQPSVSTAPAEGGASGTASPGAPLGRRRLPAHLGPARTSTVLLAVAFVAIGVLYLFVKPPEPSEAAQDPGAGSSGTSRTSDPTTQEPAPSSPSPTASSPPQEPTPEETTPPGTSATTDETPEAPVQTTGQTVPEQTVVPPDETSGPAPTTAAPSP